MTMFGKMVADFFVKLFFTNVVRFFSLKRENPEADFSEEAAQSSLGDSY